MAESRYEAVSPDEVPRFWYRLKEENYLKYQKRLVRDKLQPEAIYFIKEEIPAKEAELGGSQKGWYPFPTKNYSWREFFGARLARALHGNAADLVIPDLQERERLARHAGIKPDGLYLSRLTLSYRRDSPEVFQTDPRKAFTRNLVIAVLLRKIDFHDSNLGALADVESLMMSFDTDLILHEWMTDMAAYAANFSGNYFQLHREGNGAVLGELFELIDLEELRQTILDIKKFRMEEWLQQMQQVPGIPWADIKPLAGRLLEHQKSIETDLSNLFGRLLFSTETSEEDWRFAERIQDILNVTPGAAGLEERREQALRKLEEEMGQPTQFPLTIVRTGGRKGVRVAYEDVAEGVTLGGFIPMSQLLDIPADWIPPVKIRRWVKARQRQEERLPGRVKDISRNRKSARPVVFASQVPIGRFLSDLLEDGADPRGWLVDAYYDVNRWKNISREGRAQILRWLAEHAENIRDPDSLSKMFEWAAASLTETSEARQWAEKGMKALAAQGQQPLARRSKSLRRDQPQAAPAPHIRWAEGTLRFDHPIGEPVDELWPEEDRRAVELEVKELVSTFHARNKAAKYSRRTPVRIVARREPHVARPPNLRIKDPMRWQPFNGNGLVAVEEDAAGSVLVVPLDDGFLDLLRSQRNGKPQRFVRDGDLLHLQASFYAAIRQLTSAGLEESGLNELAEQIYRQAAIVDQQVRALEGWDHDGWEKAWTGFDALYRKQIALLQKAGLLSHVVYPASGVDLRMIDAADSILLMDYKVDHFRLKRAYEDMTQRYGLVLSPAIQQKIGSAETLKMDLGMAVDEPQLQEFLQSWSDARPHTLVLKDFSRWYERSNGHHRRDMLRELGEKLQVGDRVVVFDRDPQTADFFRAQGYQDVLPAEVVQTLEQANRLLANLILDFGRDAFFESRSPWAIYSGDLVVVLAQPLTVLQKVNVGLEEGPEATAVRDEEGRWRFYLIHELSGYFGSDGPGDSRQRAALSLLTEWLGESYDGLGAMVDRVSQALGASNREYWKQGLRARVDHVRGIFSGEVPLPDHLRSRILSREARAIAGLLRSPVFDLEDVRQVLLDWDNRSITVFREIKTIADESDPRWPAERVAQLLRRAGKVKLFGSFVQAGLRLEGDFDVIFPVSSGGEDSKWWMVLGVPLQPGQEPTLQQFEKWFADGFLSGPTLEVPAKRLFTLDDSSQSLRISGDFLAELLDQNQRARDQVRNGNAKSEWQIVRQAAALQQQWLDQSAGLEERQFQSADELVQFLEQARPRRVAHPEKAGGTHFRTFLYPDLSLVEKIPHTDLVMRSVRLAQERLGGLTLGFVIWEQASRRRVFMESVSSLKVTLEREAAAGNLDKGRLLLQRFFELTTKIIRRGVLDWDAKLENYGVTPDGRVVLLDVGGLVKVEDALEEPDFEEADLAFFRQTLGKGVPAELAVDYQVLETQFGFDSLHVMETLESQKDQDPPQPVQWTPSLRAGLEEGPRHWVAVIGAGPAGIAAAERLRELGHEVALFNEAAPYGGLAVYGVYPNKEDPMKMAYRFKSLGPAVVTPGIHYYGNVRVGKGGDLTLDQLRELGFSAVVVAVGAEGSKPLGIPGERPDLSGLYQAKDLVAFYQGDPAANGFNPQLGRTTAWIGMGNVTVDTTHYAIHRRDYEAAEKFVRTLKPEEWKRVLRELKKSLPDESEFRRNLSFYRPGVGRTVEVDELREALIKANLQEFLVRLDWAWEQTSGIEFTQNAYWMARRGPEQKAFEPKELDVLAPYIDLEDLREELDRVAVVLGWDFLDEVAMEQQLHRLLFGHPKTGTIQGNPAEKLKRFGTRLDKARIRMRFLVRGQSIEGDRAGGIVFAENQLNGSRVIETDRVADRGELFHGTPIDSVILSIGNEHDADFGLETRRGLFTTREKVPAGENPSQPAHFQSVAAEDVFLAGWALQPSTGKVGEAKGNGVRAIELAVGPYLSERSDRRKTPEALQENQAALDRALEESRVQRISGGQAAALHAWFIQNGYQPNQRAEILGIAQDLEERKVKAELLGEARLPAGARIFAQKNAIPRTAQKLFAEQGIEVVELPNDVEKARALLEAAGDLSNAVGWLSASVEWFERDEWNDLFAGLGMRAVQLVGVMPYSVDRWSIAHWAALFGAFPQAGLQVILSVEEQRQLLSIYV